jgi:TPR repeat protein
MELERRCKENEPEAAFFYGIYNWRICGGIESANNSQFDNVLKNCWLESLESLKVASNAKIAEASFNIGRVYEKGWGVLPSKLVAADWYVKAAQQFNETGSRDEALTSIESALNAVHDHPAALRLKNVLLK